MNESCRTGWRGTALRCADGIRVLICALAAFSLQAAAVPWIASVEVIPAAPGADPTTVRGVVFDDRNGDGRQQADEPGIAGVVVSNGLDVTVTDDSGSYALPVRDDMNLAIVQPAGWQAPVDARQVPQFFHIHKRHGSPEGLRFEGLPAAGPAPERVNFPLQPSAVGDDFRCAILGDSQPYSNTEVGYFRDSTVVDLLAFGDGYWDCMVYLGDVVGDDLGLLDRLLEIGSRVGAPQYLVHGNHDMDLDATAHEDAADSWRRLYGPQYYAVELGQVLFVALDNIYYPCDAESMTLPEQEICEDPDRPDYNGRIDAVQMQWLENVLAHVPEEKLVIFGTHIPMVSFTAPASTQHQTDNVLELYALLDGRPALSLSAHTHALEHLAPGDTFAGWQEAVGVDRLPFRHIIAGATAGAWWQGDFDIHGIPMSLQRLGAPRGFLELAISGTRYRERYLGSRLDPARVMWVAFNTPPFRHWFETILEWGLSDREERDPVPPYSINDLPDTRILTPEDLAEGVWLTVNVWLGSSETEVVARIGDGPVRVLERTQQADGEEVRIGPEWADPFAAARQLSVARYALESRSGEPRNQGIEIFTGMGFGPAPPQPMYSLADRNPHLWRLRLPEDLAEGVHRVQVESTDRHGVSSSEHAVFEVRAERPPPRWRRELWD